MAVFVCGKSAAESGVGEPVSGGAEFIAGLSAGWGTNPAGDFPAQHGFGDGHAAGGFDQHGGGDGADSGGAVQQSMADAGGSDHLFGGAAGGAGDCIPVSAG